MTNIFPKPTRISLGDVTLEVFEAGRENAGRPIVLCHGWPELAYSWRHQIPRLAEAGYHVIAPNQRGFGRSSRPDGVEAYDINCLTGDLTRLLDHFGYEAAPFVGHDWGANVVWSLAQLHPARVQRIIALAMPYQERGAVPWVTLIESLLGGENYIVHFNRHPGVADRVLEENTRRFLGNLFRKGADPVMSMMAIAQAEAPSGQPILSDAELDIYAEAFNSSGFTPSINWYRNLDRNWHLLEPVDPLIRNPALMLYGAQDTIPRNDRLGQFVPNLEEQVLDGGHWLHQENPKAVTRAVLDWLARTA